MATENEEGVEVEETLDLPEVVEGEEDTTDWKAEAQKLRDKAIAQRERTKAYKQKLAEKDKAIEALANAKKDKEASPQSKSELDEAVLDFLELKGYEDPEEVKVFTTIMKKTGMSHREVIKDEYALAKVKSIREEKAVKNATPSATKRGGGQTNDIASAIAKFEATGELPTDYEFKTQVVNAITDRSNSNKPSWQ